MLLERFHVVHFFIHFFFSWFDLFGTTFAFIVYPLWMSDFVGGLFILRFIRFFYLKSIDIEFF